METISAWAEGLARTLLERALPRRWAHVQGVAARARSLAPAVGADTGLLEAAAWLHDIGYLPELAGPACTASTAPATCATSSTPTRCCAAWSLTTPAPSSRPKNAAWPTS